MRFAPLAILAATLAGTASAQPEDDTSIGGVGRMSCAQVTGPQNAPYLGQAGDWALGYMAGRIDAGQPPIDGSTLSSADTIDVVAGIALRCRETPEMPVIDAVRAFAEQVTGEPAQGGAVAADPPPPPPDLPPEAEDTGLDHAPRPEPRPEIDSDTAEGTSEDAEDTSLESEAGTEDQDEPADETEDTDDSDAASDD